MKSHAAVLCALVLSACGGTTRSPEPAPTPAPAAAPAGSPELRYTARVMGRVNGSLVLRVDGNTSRVAYEYADRGRGPKLTGTIVRGPDGRVAERSFTGVDYYKKAVDESYVDDGATRRWKDAVGTGSQAATTPAVYVPVNATAIDQALLVRQVVAAGGHLPFAQSPEAEVRVAKVERVTVRVGETSRQVDLYEVSGLTMDPGHVWLEGDDFFAEVSTWSDLLPDGWQSVAQTLLEHQQVAEHARHHRIAALARKPTGPVVFKNVGVFDTLAGRVLPGRTVIVRGERIEKVGLAKKVAVPPGALVIDGAGKTLLPGLWDSHVHVSENDGPLHLAAGVTTGRDLANDIDSVARIQKAWDSGEMMGPRLLMAGFMDGTSPFTGPTKIVVDTEEQAAAAVTRYAELGYVQIKVYSSIKKELVPVITRLAHAAGMRVSGHIPWELTAEQAVRTGFDEIQHANFLALNFLMDVAGDTRTPSRFTAVGEYATRIDLASPEVAAFTRLLVEKGTVIDPTIAIFQGLLTARAGTPDPTYAMILDRLPPLTRRAHMEGGAAVPAGKEEQFRASYRRLLELVAHLHKAGVRVVAGTDDLAGFTLHSEIELYVEAGLSTVDALRTATLVPAQVMKREKELGTIEAGKLADLVLVEGDPTVRIRDIRNTALTVKGGVLYVPKDIYAALGVRHPVESPLPK